ncbi:MAG TPA: MG2 domain-containing protein, partial [Blastocatellia bacterium]|nr:MG2 domain-containing protein [Blastocatellia bacterium]
MRFADDNRLKVTVALLGCVLTAFLLAFPPQHDVLAADNELAAIYRNSSLEVSIPYNAELTRSGSFTLEIVDPGDSVIAQQHKPVSTSRDSGPWRATISLDKKVALEDLAWDRLKISAGEESTIVSLSEILHLPVVKIFAQSSYAAGSAASARIITVDSKSTNPLRGSLLKVELIDGEHSSTLFTGRTDAFGTAQVAFTIPAGIYGGRQLRVSAETSLGSVVANQPIQIEARDKILLTTDKPIYQPAQTIHLRALAFDGPTRNAAADRPITLEVEDAKGNKVFKNRGRTDRFGIASADFELADEVNCGAYHIRALLGNEGAQKMQEKTVTVDRYTLPKFKVDIELGASDRAQQRASYYSPGETVSGSITARYLFGKPLTNAEVTLTMTTFDVQSVELARITGKTDKEGRLAFSSKLPDFLAGRPMQQGSAPVAIAAQVKDTAEHVEAKSRDILVSRTPILIMAVPESGQLMPGLENRVYILTSYPDGAPARTIVTGSIENGQIETDASGVAIVTLKAANGPIELSLKATDSKGRSAKTNVKLESQVGSQSLMLRTNKSVYKVGEKLELETISTKPRGAIYLDVVKDGQTLITRAIESKGNRGDLTLDLTPSM